MCLSQHDVLAERKLEKFYFPVFIFHSLRILDSCSTMKTIAMIKHNQMSGLSLSGVISPLIDQSRLSSLQCSLCGSHLCLASPPFLYSLSTVTRLNANCSYSTRSNSSKQLINISNRTFFSYKSHML